MKKLLTMGLVCLLSTGWSQTHTEKITKELSFEVNTSTNALLVDNVSGSIRVEGYSGSTVQVEVEKIIQGKTAARLEKGKSEISLGVIDRADTIILFIDGLCNSFGKVDKRQGNGSGWGYRWENCNNREHEYDFKLNFVIRVPSSVNLLVSTINDGNIAVSGTSGRVKASNVNGHINLSGLSQATSASTINGNVDIAYVANPASDCRFYTLNGDINAYFKKGFSSDVSFKSFNGEFFTNLANLEALPVEVQKDKTGKGMKYKINGNRYRTGSGGAHIDFETFNGNVYLREQ